MVDILQAEGVSRYYHVAWADDADGTNFSLTEYDGAVMIGTYNDDSGTESTNPADYTWQIIGAAESDGDGDPATAAAENEINALTAAVDDLTAKTITNAGNIDRANASSVEGIGQPNLLSGTNRGAAGWTGSGFTLAAETGTVYNETDTPITWLKATCVTPGALSFTADGFRAILAEDSDTDTYTLSFDMRQSVLFDVNVSMSDADGTNTQIDFGTADNESDILEDLRDMAGTWTHQALTAQIVDGNTESAQVLLFDCSNMTAGDTIEIANLKIESGAIDTPWKASAEEAMTAAEAAMETANTKKTVFVTTPEPPYHVGDLWVKFDPSMEGLVDSDGNSLIDDQGALFQAAILQDAAAYVCMNPKLEGQTFSEDDFELATADNGLREWFWHDALGAHVLGDVTGFRNDIDSTGMHIVDTNTETTVARFASDGAQIGQSDAPHTEIDAQGQRVYAAYGSDVSKAFEVATSGSVVTINVTDTFASVRAVTDMPVVLSSVPDSGSQITVQVDVSSNTFTQGTALTRIIGGVMVAYDGDHTFLMTSSTLMYGFITYSATVVSPFFSLGTRAGTAGAFSTIVGKGLYAENDNQVAIGAFNTNNASMLFQVGNGTSDSARSDAFGVDTSGSIYPAGVKMADFVTTEGTSGSWRYRKWNSGKIEAWFEGTFSCAASTTARGALYYSNWSLTIPNDDIGFTATPNTLIGNTGDSTTVIAVNGAATSATAMSGYVWRYASSSSALTISARIYAWQD